MGPVAPAPAAQGAAPPPDRVAAARRVATQFEAMALAQFLQPMFATVDSSKSAFGGGMGEAMFRPMLVEEMARAVAADGHGIGIREAVMREILRMEGNGR